MLNRSVRVAQDDSRTKIATRLHQAFQVHLKSLGSRDGAVLVVRVLPSNQGGSAVLSPDLAPRGDTHSIHDGGSDEFLGG